MISDLFKKRMEMQGSCLGEKQIKNSNNAELATFRNDINYRKGIIYDWDMTPIESVEFKFEKINNFSFEKPAVEYMVRFKPGFQPERDYRNLHFRQDGKERLGFYLDIYNYDKGDYEKWMIVGKDDQTLFDRYNVLKCNWFFEWIHKGRYRRCLGIVRDAADNAFNSTNTDAIGGTRISGSNSFILPYNADTAKIAVGSSFIFSDNIELPQVFKINQIKDNTVPGVIRYYAKEDLFNKHRDYVGEVNSKDINFAFETPIPDLPQEYGGSIHMLCDAIYEAVDEGELDDYDEDTSLEISTTAHDAIYVNGSPARIQSNVPVSGWVIKVDGVEYTSEELEPYFEIEEAEESLSIKAINKVMVNYTVTVSAVDGNDVSEEIRLVVRI